MVFLTQFYIISMVLQNNAPRFLTAFVACLKDIRFVTLINTRRFKTVEKIKISKSVHEYIELLHTQFELLSYPLTCSIRLLKRDSSL